MKCTSRKHTRSCGKSTSSTPAPSTTQANSRKIIAHLDKLEDSHFKPLRGTDGDKAETLYWNLWGMYGFTPERVAEMKQAGKIPSVTDYTWTQEVADAFYQHRNHRTFIKRMEKTFALGMLKLNMEPSLANRPGAKE